MQVINCELVLPYSVSGLSLVRSRDIVEQPLGDETRATAGRLDDPGIRRAVGYTSIFVMVDDGDNSRIVPHRAGDVVIHERDAFDAVRHLVGLDREFVNSYSIATEQSQQDRARSNERMRKGLTE